MDRQPSRPVGLTGRILGSQILILALLGVIAVSLGVRLNYVMAQDQNVERAVEYVRFDAAGKLAVDEQALIRAMATGPAPGWAIVQVSNGERRSYGRVPRAIAAINLDDVEFADVTWRERGRHVAVRAKSFVVDGRQVRILAPGGGLPYLSPRSEFLLGAIALVGLLALLIMSVVSLSTAPGAIRRAVAALRKASQQAEDIELTGRSMALATDDLPLDVRPLVDTLNETLAKLQRAYADQGTFLRDAAHELRTPIAILALRIEELADHPLRPKIARDVDRLAAVADQLLDLQRAKEQTTNFVPIDLLSTANRVLAEIAPLAIEGGYELSLESDNTPVTVTGDIGAIERMMMNLLQNAIRYGGNAGLISLRVSEMRYFEVADEGPGFAPELQGRLFDPFVRGERSGPGTGLGLYLVRQIALIHGATVSVRSGVGTGACIRVQFP